MTISLDSYLSGGGAVSSFTPTGGYVSGVTTSGAVTIDITAPTGKKIVFTHFRGVRWGSSDNQFNVGNISGSRQVITALSIDGVDVAGSIASLSDAMGKMQQGYAGSTSSDASYTHPFVGFKMSTFNASFTVSSAYVIAYTYYIADE